MKISLILVSLFLLSSCSFFGKKEILLGHDVASFNQVEEAGTFISNRESGFDKNKNYVVKQNVTNAIKTDEVLEKSITISQVSSVVKNTKVLVPHKSQATYFLDGKKYDVFMNFESSSNRLTVKMVSPEKQWDGMKTYTLPKNNGNICFYSNIIECSIITGFFDLAIEKSGGQMGLYVIWEGYPYFHEQFLNIIDSPFAQATLSYDGKNRKGEHRFTLDISGQSQFFFVTDKKKIVRHVWSAQGFMKSLK